jgi:hypothetical protein
MREDLNESSGRSLKKAIRLVSKAAQGQKIKTFCGAVIGNSQKVFFI